MKSKVRSCITKTFLKTLNSSTVTKFPNVNNQKDASLINTKLTQLRP